MSDAARRFGLALLALAIAALATGLLNLLMYWGAGQLREGLDADASMRLHLTLPIFGALLGVLWLIWMAVLPICAFVADRISLLRGAWGHFVVGALLPAAAMVGIGLAFDLAKIGLQATLHALEAHIGYRGAWAELIALAATGGGGALALRLSRRLFVSGSVA